MSFALQAVARLHDLLDICWPSFCPGCRTLVEERATLCPRCDRQLPWLRGPICAMCGDVLPGAPGLCRRCRESAPAFRAGRSALLFEGVVRQVLLAWKYDGVRYYEPLVRSWMRTFALGLDDTRYRRVDALVAVPLHPRRLHWRGFNQATVLAQVVAYQWDLPLWQGALLRTKFTTPQQRSKSGAQRSRNLQAAFEVPDRALIAGKRILLIDDVATTGSTLQACAETLRAARASSVTFLTLARQSTASAAQHAPAPGQAVQGLE